VSDNDETPTATGVRQTKAPFPWYGGKQHAAPLIWEALGDPAHYVDPFAGSLAVPLLRPHTANRTYYSETVNDANGLLCNAWRSIALAPDATADAASWPVCEADIMARHFACLAWAADPDNLSRLEADPRHHDAEIGGWWLYGICGWIGSGWCSGEGPWVVSADGRVTRQPKSGGVNRQLPHLGNDGQGVHRPQLRAPGVNRQLPHLGNNGMGVSRPQLREPGVGRQLPHLGDNGMGVHHAGTRAPGVWDEDDFHPMTMPELRAWFRFLAARLRHVRIVNGDWRRVATSGALQTLPVRQGKGAAGVFLDPPYSGAVRTSNLYANDSDTIAGEVRAWCLANGATPCYRIVLAGFAGEGHETLEAHGWRCIPWYQAGFLRGGMGNQNADGHQMHRERLWLSPHCLETSAERAPVVAPLWAWLDSLETPV